MQRSSANLLHSGSNSVVDTMRLQLLSSTDDIRAVFFGFKLVCLAWWMLALDPFKAFAAN